MDENLTVTESAANIAIEGTEQADTDTQQDSAENAATGKDTASAGEENGNPQTDADGVDNSGNDGADEQSAEEEPFLTTRHNHEVRRFSREETEDLVQIGLYSKPQLDRLRYFAALGGNENVNAALDNLIAAQENVIRSEMSKKVSDPELLETVVAAKLAEFKTKAGQQEQAEKDAYNAEGDNINRRLGREFAELQKDFPDVEKFDDLPKSVKRTAAEQGVPLKYAYALHLQQEQAKINEADKAAKSAAAASTGSSKDVPNSGTSPEIAQMMRALWGD